MTLNNPYKDYVIYLRVELDNGYLTNMEFYARSRTAKEAVEAILRRENVIDGNPIMASVFLANDEGQKFRIEPETVLTWEVTQT